MAAHPIASATVSFGLVSIPVKLYSASQPSASISFNLLHKTCGSRLKQQYFCQKDGEKVERGDMAKGYEYSKGEYVIFTEEELKDIEEKATQSVDITEFVPKEAIDPVYFDKPYFLGPEKGGERAYRLLAKAMEKTGRWALAKYAARGKMYLVLVRPMAGGLSMQQLHYADEIRSFTDVYVSDAEVSEKELNLAIQLTDQVTSQTFHPEAYEDEVKKRLTDLIQQKVEGHEVSFAPVEEPKAQIIDLVQALQASLAKGAAPAPAEAASERKPAKRAPRLVEAEPAAEEAKPRKRASR
jgi:DNA end-binding protein Ku